MKKSLAAASCACGVILVSLMTGVPASASESPPGAATQFIDSLTADAANGDAAAAEALREYDALDSAETKEFERAVTLLAEGSADPASIPGVDMVEDAGSTLTASLGRAGAASWSAWCSQRASILGVAVTETRVDADFDTNGGRVTGIRNQRARVVTNFVPMSNVNFLEIRKETGSTGTVRALVRVDRGPLYGIGSQTENWQSLAVNGSGKVTSCRWGY